MNNPFGQFSDDSTQAFNEAMAERFDFKQCQRSDGTIYGVPDKSNCAQKGAKEVKKDAKAAEGVEWFVRAANRNKTDAKDLNFDKLSNAELKSAINSIKSENRMANKYESDYAAAEKVGKAIRTLSDRSKGEGKGAVSVSSLLSKKDLKDISSDPKKMKSFLKGLGVSENSPEMKNAMAIINKGKPAAKPKPKLADKEATRRTKTKAAPKPKAKAESRYSYEDNRKQYKAFYNMVRNQGLGHGDAAGAAEDAMRASGFDPGDISNQYRKEVREAF